MQHCTLKEAVCATDQLRTGIRCNITVLLNKPDVIPKLVKVILLPVEQR